MPSTISLNENLIRIAEVPKHLPGRPNVSTVYRWLNSGKLESVMIGGRRWTSTEAIARFVDRSTSGAATPSEVSERRKREIEKAEAKLRDSAIS
ncbi:MAG: DUF1580 domain-containing protein [Planctomycetes bacterium]|nr:DUF1580 domain-containing protein [Planctomycetota bacterium]